MRFIVISAYTIVAALVSSNESDGASVLPFLLYKSNNRVHDVALPHHADVCRSAVSPTL